MEIRPERTDDEPAVASIHAAAFPHQPAQVVALVNDLRSSTDERDRSRSSRSRTGGRRPRPVHADPPRRPGRGRSGTRLSPSACTRTRSAAASARRSIGEGLRILDERGVPAVFLEGTGVLQPLRLRAGGAARLSQAVAPHSRSRPSRFASSGAYEAWMTGTFVYSEPFWRNDVVGLRGERLARRARRQLTAPAPGLVRRIVEACRGRAIVPRPPACRRSGGAHARRRPPSTGS